MNYWNYNQSERETVGYLLGDLPEDKMTDFEKRYFADDELFDHMLLVKHELVDAYVRNHLDAETRIKFERHFLATPGGKEEVVFARALREKLNEPQSLITAEKKRKSRWSELFGAWSWPELGLAAAALLLVAIGFGWLAIENRRLSQELASTRTEREAESKQNEELRETLAHRTAPTPAPTPIRIVPPPLKPSAKNNEVFIVYLHSDDRAGSENKFELPGDERSLSVDLKLLFTPVNMRCNVTLQTPDGAKLERRNLLATKNPNGGIYVRANFGTVLLKPGEYEAIITSVAAHNNRPITVRHKFSLKISGKS